MLFFSFFPVSFVNFIGFFVDRSGKAADLSVSVSVCAFQSHSAFLVFHSFSTFIFNKSAAAVCVIIKIER